MKAIDYSYFIERYISGEMDQVEKAWFEKEMEYNDTLKKEIALRRKTDEMLFRHDVMDLRAKLSGIEKTRKEKEIARRTILRQAAILACFVLLGSMLLYMNRNLSPGAVYEKNFTVYSAGVTARNSGTSFNAATEVYNKGLTFYNNGKYREAAGVLREYLKTKPDHMEACLVYGVASMKTCDFTEAVKSFSTIIDNGNNLYIDNARWYLALTYIKTNDIESAKKELLLIRDSNSIYSKKAGKILKRIK